ncbi:chromosome segregation protein SMC [Blautia obeum]|uniref:Chromosome partition protein Smc n=1 Tax=Blautia obeum TaxID=40520 RepID=A0A414SJW8_9FIRM|nr:chromosome segregation protein SMC [Blautia obeum]RHG19874.1 chromosome segregation protein SMC [Blautia obeum]
MYLKNIEVYGFKSFAQKINFEFHNGITGIVGPNGSGKSNVGDAVRWVLGEQSAKQLRGGNMQDVIFSGTENRKPLSFASVSITLDNSDHKLPVDYNEVTVTRRLYRSGESEYLINGSGCRLKDIQEMFYDTGIGKEGYSIIGQGQIDKILSGKPEERRELFDEAAGIVKFKRRKATTLKKLDEERQNLVRVTDILSELTKQLGPLEKQSETARIYLAKREELKELDVNLFLLDHQRTGELLKELEEKLEQAQRELNEAQAAYDQTKIEYDRLEQELEDLNHRLDTLKEEQQQNALLKQQYEGQVQVLEEQISSGKQNSEHYQNRLTALGEDLDRRTQEKEKLAEDKLELQSRLKEIRASLSKETEALENIVSNVEECTQAVEDGKNEIIEILNSRATTKGKVQRFDAMLEQLNIRKAEISQRILRLKSEEEVLEKERLNAQKQYDAVTAVIHSTNEECVRLDGEVQKLQDELKKQNSQMEIGQTAYHREASRLESLKNITERYDGYGNSIRRVMEQKNREPGIKGVVADIIHVQKDYEVAIETALGGSIQNIVTDNEQTAKRMIGFLKKNRFGRATFLPLSNISGRGGLNQRDVLSEPGVVGTANTLVNADKEYSELVMYLLGRVLVVDNIDHAIAIGKKYRHSLRMVTIEGESLSPGGSMTGGAFKNNSNLLGRRREIEELERSVGILRKELEETQKSIGENRSRRNVLRDTIADFQQKLRQQYVEQNTAKMNLEQLKEKEGEIQNSYRQIDREQEELRHQAGEIRQDHSSIARELEDSQKDEKELETFIETKQKELEEWKAEETEKTHELEKIRLEESSLEQQNQFLQENLSRLNSEIAAFQKESQEITENLVQSREEIHKKEEGIQELKNAAQECLLKEEQYGSQRAQWQEEKEKRSASHKTFFEKRDHLSEKTSLLDKECFRLRSQTEKIEEQREGQISYMWEEYEITPNNALQYRKEELTDRQAIKADVTRIKDEIRKLGSVNVNAIEDYKELLERHTFLSGQYDDIVKAEETLEGIILELDEGMRKQFTEKFRDIQREFDKAFKELFGGGKGTLELAEDEDILEAGIRIISQPPGKKLQNMMQLSGGEKALTAIALLFAIQNLKPSPFCFLDEIEAALDDSNVGRFASYLQKLTKNTQFIIITHRRGTMNAADRLYGITMQEKGVSTLVSVDLVENQLSK